MIHCLHLAEWGAIDHASRVSSRWRLGNTGTEHIRLSREGVTQRLRMVQCQQHKAGYEPTAHAF